MKVTLKSIVPLSAEKVWEFLKLPKNIEALAAPEVVFLDFNWGTSEFEVGVEYSGLVSNEGLPTLRYHIQFQVIDNRNRYSRSIEHGGYLKKWIHHRTIEEISENSALISDKFEIRAGWRTLFLWFFIKNHYRKRYSKLHSGEELV